MGLRENLLRWKIQLHACMLMDMIHQSGKKNDNEGREGIAEALFFCLKKDGIQCISEVWPYLLRVWAVFYRNLRRYMLKDTLGR